MVDVSINEGGISETFYPTNHKQPIYIKNGVVHYCVPNIPGIVSKTSTIALNHALFPYLKELIKGEKYWFENSGIEKGLVIYKGKLRRDILFKS